jgi:hypothetical protein
MSSQQVIRHPGESEHIVQLFDSSKSLAETVANFLWMALDRGDNVLVAATPPHIHLLTGRLEDRGWSVREAIAAKRMVVLDANATLDTFMRQNTPNAVAFDEVVGTAVRQLSDGCRVWIYGEMVDVLAAKGNYKGAHALEELWNQLGKRECFTLFCGYASGHFGDARHTGMLNEICKSHTHVHRKADDLLAEYLLEQPEVRAAATTPSATTFPSQP